MQRYNFNTTKGQVAVEFPDSLKDITLGQWTAYAKLATRDVDVIDRLDMLSAIEGEDDIFLGKGLPSGPFDFLETPADKECFLDLVHMAGGVFANRLVDDADGEAAGLERPRIVMLGRAAGAR